MTTSLIDNCPIFNGGLFCVFCIFIALRQFSLKMLPLLLFGLSGLAFVLLELTQTEINPQLMTILGILILTNIFISAFLERRQAVQTFKNWAKSFLSWGNS